MACGGSSESRGSGAAKGEDDESATRQTNRRPSWYVRATSNLKVEDTSLLRAMPLACGLRNFGSVLGARPPTARYYRLSGPVERIDTFISHNWTTPRLRKFLVLVFHFNLGLASVISFGVAIGACSFTAYGMLPSVNGCTPWTPDAKEIPRGALCLPLGLATFFLSLCFVHELDWMSWRRCARRHVVFLDKTCVDQVDDKRKRQGIQCLAAFMARSDAFLVVYSDVYMQRLWTIYECASWLLLHPGEPLIVSPVLSPILVLSGLLVVALCDTYIAVMHAAAFTKHITPVMAEVVLACILVPALSIGAWLMARLTEDHEKIEDRVAKFTLADAQCANKGGATDLSTISENDNAVVRRALPHGHLP